MRTWRREWLHKIGWFEASVAARAAEDVEQLRATVDAMLEASWEENERLEERLEAALNELELVSLERDQLLEDRDKLPPGPASPPSS